MTSRSEMGAALTYTGPSPTLVWRLPLVQPIDEKPVSIDHEVFQDEDSNGVMVNPVVMSLKTEHRTDCTIVWVTFVCGLD